MQKTDIDWADESWNPVTGCLHGCEYCYARGIARRFAGRWSEELQRNLGADGGMHVLDKPLYRHTTGKNRDKPVHSVQAPFPYGFDPTFHRYRLRKPARKKKPQTVFVGSMCDLFGNWVSDEWIEEVFAACAAAPQHRYLFLTKNPARYTDLYGKGLLPDADNYWFGSTATTQEQPFWWSDLHNTFVSIEPVLKHFDFRGGGDMKTDWVIVGEETGNRKGKVVPKREWIDNIVAQCRAAGVPVFMKDSLIPIMGEENMMRDFPWD